MDIEDTCPYDKFKAIKKYTTKVLFSYSNIKPGRVLMFTFVKIEKR